MANNTTTKYTTKQVFVDVFVDNNQKRLKQHLANSRGYLTTFADGERKDIALRFLGRIEQAVSDAYDEALAEDAESTKAGAFGAETGEG